MRFTLGDWEVDPASNSLSRAGERRTLEPRAMRVLQALCHRPGDVLSAEQLLAECWPEQPLGDNPVHKTVAQLRRALDDSATEPRYLETIRKRGYRTVAPVLSAGGPATQAREGAWRGGSPFRGLQAFDASHAEVFFGREAALREALDALHALWRRQRAFLLLLGPSGSGKTSLVLAGLFPALRRELGAPHGLSATQIDLGDVGNHAPLAALAAALLDWDVADRPVFPGASAESLARSLAEHPQTVLAEIEAALAGRGEDAALLLFVDRLEALFVAPQFDSAARQALLQVLQLLADSGRVAVVAACRNDFYPRLAEHALLMRDKQQGAHLDLAAPTPAEIAQMIRLPARAAGLSFGIDAGTRTRLDDQLCDDAARSPDALPLLQYTLEELYRQRGPHGELSFEAYRQLGGLEGAVGLRAEAVLAGLLPQQQAAAPQVLALLVMLSGEGSRVTGRRAAWAELQQAAARELVQALVEARLLVSDLVDGEAGFRVAHEAILRRWPRVTEWIAARQQALQLRSRLRQQVARWEAEARAGEYLLPKGRQLIEAGELLEHSEIKLGDAERAFIAASQRQAARGRQLRMAAVAALGVLAVLSAALAWRANQAEGVARQRSAQADDLLGYMLGEFADKLRPIGRLELLDSVGSKALDHLSAPGPGGGDPAALLQRAKALTVIGEVRVTRGDLAGAVQPLQTAEQLLSAPGGVPDQEAERLKALGAAAFWQGFISYEQGAAGPAAQAWERYRRAAEAMVQAQPEAVDGWVELSYAHNSLGSAAFRLGQLERAEQDFQASLALKEKALGKRPDDQTLKAYWADSLSWLGRVQETRGDYASALQAYARRVGVEAQLQAAAPGELQWSHRLAIAEYTQGRLLSKLERGADALALLQPSQARLLPLLRQQPRRMAWQDSRFWTDFELLTLQPGTPAQRLHKLQALSDAMDEVYKDKQGRTTTQLLRAHLAQLRARQHAELKQADAELTQLEQAEQALGRVLAKGGDDIDALRRLAQVRLRRADILKGSGQTEAARQSCQQASKELGARTELLMTGYELTALWVRAQDCLGQADGVAKARRWLEQRRQP